MSDSQSQSTSTGSLFLAVKHCPTPLSPAWQPVQVQSSPLSGGQAKARAMGLPFLKQGPECSTPPLHSWHLTLEEAPQQRTLAGRVKRVSLNSHALHAVPGDCSFPGPWFCFVCGPAHQLLHQIRPSAVVEPVTWLASRAGGRPLRLPLNSLMAMDVRLWPAWFSVGGCILSHPEQWASTVAGCTACTTAQAQGENWQVRISGM